MPAEIDITLIDFDIDKAEKKLQQLNSSLNRVKTSATGVGNQGSKGFTQADKSVQRLNSSLGRLRNLAAGAIAAFASFRTLKGIVDITANFEDLQTSLNAVFQSAEEGQRQFQIIQDFATKTPFSVEALTKSFIQLRGSGIEPTTELLTAFGNAASTTVDKTGALESITRLWFKAVGKGKIELDELNQLAERGIPVFDILRSKLSESGESLSDLQKTSQGSQRILDILFREFSEGSQFAGAMEASLGNLSVSLSNLGIAARNAIFQIGKGGFGDAIKGASDALTELITNNEEVAKSIGEGLASVVDFSIGLFATLGENIELVKAGLLGLISVGAIKFFSGLITNIQAASLAMETFNFVTLKNPLFRAGAIALAIGATIFGLDALTGSLANTGREVRDTATESRKLEESFKYLTTPELKRLTSDIQSQFEDLQASMRTVRTRGGSFIPNKEEIRRQGEELTSEIDRINNEIAKRIQAGIEKTERVRRAEAQQTPVVINQEALKKALNDLESFNETYIDRLNNLRNAIEANQRIIDKTSVINIVDIGIDIEAGREIENLNLQMQNFNDEVDRLVNIPGASAKLLELAESAKTLGFELNEEQKALLSLTKRQDAIIFTSDLASQNAILETQLLRGTLAAAQETAVFSQWNNIGTQSIEVMDDLSAGIREQIQRREELNALLGGQALERETDASVQAILAKRELIGLTSDEKAIREQVLDLQLQQDQVLRDLAAAGASQEQIQNQKVRFEIQTQGFENVIRSMQEQEQEFKNLQILAKGFEDTLQGVFASIFEDGKASFKGLVDVALKAFTAIAAQAASAEITGALFDTAAPQSQFGPGGPAGLINTGINFLSSLFEQGGIVGQSAPTRAVPAAVFANAPRYEQGGFPGLLRPNEVPIIAHKGEEVLSANDSRNRLNGGGGQQVVNINISGVRDADDINRSKHQIERELGLATRRGARASAI